MTIIALSIAIVLLDTSGNDTLSHRLAVLYTRCFASRAKSGNLLPNRALPLLYTARRLPLVLHSSYTVGSAYLDGIECRDCINLREAQGVGEYKRERKVLSTLCCNHGINKGLLEYITLALSFTSLLH